MGKSTIGNSDAIISERLNKLFVAQAARPLTLDDIKPSRLTPFQRALLVTDGTVTHLIEAYTFSPVEVVPLRETEQALGIEYAWLELPIGDPVVTREVVLQTPTTDTRAPKIHAYAISHLIYERLPNSVVEGLKSRAGGLGALLQRTIWETRRDLLWWGVERAVGLPDAIGHLESKPFLSRTYRVVAKKDPLMFITEKFPLDESSLED
ncbi:MAG: chorismate pyruvate-lyase family protein [Candidatus Poribacteria bacterium]|nr:chorismate pyruvate-lyase family protein [Candidatus Poribacteria bacterium]MDD9973763.1 chorismate pyruvate-lyase family protein [Candidatus Poribacteria bacterium]MDE0325437.1 chorismate pyruvate-lyase family protein [Candidatus Poribacteria bacterium]